MLRILGELGGVEIYMEDAGKFDARYRAFLETISQLRPQLHRYCSRMTGSITDGEDVVQDALFRAYRSLDTFDDSRPLVPWLFRIAHNQCIDFHRRRGVRERRKLRQRSRTSSSPATLGQPSAPLSSTWS